jgi:RNase P/RNase MRP subunit POP5
MPIAADTSPEADAAQVEAYRRMGGTARVEAMFRLTRMARSTAEAGIRSRHPDYDDARVALALARLIYGDDLVRHAWPGRQLVDP